MSRIVAGALAGLVAAALLWSGALAPLMAQQVNPTELSVQEEALLGALQSGETLSGRVSIPNAVAGDLIKPGGPDWSALHNATLRPITLWSLLGMLGVLVLFYLFRGRIRIDSGLSGQTIQRFGAIERFAHWLTAVPFVLLALSGLNLVLGRYLLLPLIGPDAFGWVSSWAKMGHNFLAWPFMLGVLLTFLVWVKDNLPSGVDATWIAQGGGLFSKGKHPPARKFNAGQKLIFWSVVLGGAALSVSGILLLFPQAAGVSANWQLAQIVHGLVAAVLTAIILAHIYIGSVGMEGAFDAMGTGEVDLNWAREHHSLWVEERLGQDEVARSRTGHAAPAE